VAGASGGFHDVVPLRGGRWGVAVGDVTAQAQGTDVPVAAHVDVARAVIRTMAQAGFRPSMVLAGTNRALLAARDQSGAPRPACSLAAAYATVRPSPVGTWARICVAGPRTAFLRRNGGRLLAVGGPGAPLGVRPDPELPDCRVLLRTGDILILVTAGVTEGLGGPERICQLLADAGRASAARSTDNILRAVRDAGGGLIKHEAVAVALKSPGSKRDPGQHSAGWPGRGRYAEAEPTARWPGRRRGAADRTRFPF
jgi:hypothetical protein